MFQHCYMHINVTKYLGKTPCKNKTICLWSNMLLSASKQEVLYQAQIKTSLYDNLCTNN